MVVTYCSTGSPHDQWFFRRPQQMVAGAVTPPRLDLANEDLVRAHVQAVWLAETGADLKKSLCDILDVGGTDPSLKLADSVLADITKDDARRRGRQRAVRILEGVRRELERGGWYSEEWLDGVLHQVHLACRLHLAHRSEDRRRVLHRDGRIERGEFCCDIDFARVFRGTALRDHVDLRLAAREQVDSRLELCAPIEWRRRSGSESAAATSAKPPPKDSPISPTPVPTLPGIWAIASTASPIVSMADGWTR